MRDFIPEGEDAGSPTGVGGFRDFVPQEEIDAKKAENEAKSLAQEEVAKPKRQVAVKNKKAEKKVLEAKKAEKFVEPKSVEVEEEVIAPQRGKKHSFK